MAIWNPWHGCHKTSPGCKNCYVYRRDAEFGKDSSIVTKTKSFDMPLKKDRKGQYKLQPDGEPVYCCMTSDFWVEEADAWRPDIWDIIRVRQDLEFVIITKRIQRFEVGLPYDWGDGWDHVTILSTCEDQTTANARLPYIIDFPIKHRGIIHEPMLGRIDIETALASGKIESVVCGGESGEEARECDYSWVLYTMEQCVKHDVAFSFKQTGARFRKGDKVYNISRDKQHIQAKKAGIDYIPGMGIPGFLKHLEEMN